MVARNALFEKVISETPDYKVFMTVDEMNESSRRLAEAYPGLVTLRQVGASRQGDPILALKIGDYPRNAFLFGCPHPNEPIGTMMLEYLSWRLAQDAELREALGYTWHIIKCIDPDGTRLNEGWFKGPFTPRNYARHFFRPASQEQAEWTFPITYKTLRWDKPIPETQALMNVIDEVRPDFMFSLHNAGFGGVYYYVSAEYPELYPILTGLARDQGLPLSLGEPEMPYARALAPAVYAMPSTRDTYDYYATYTKVDPATIIPAGTSSFDYARERGTKLTLVCEMPYFYDPRIDDTSPAMISRREAVLHSVEIDRKFLAMVREKLEPIRHLLSARSPFMTALDLSLKNGPRAMEAKAAWAEKDPSMPNPATVAQVFDNFHVSRFYKSLSLGMLVRAIEYQLALTPSTELENARRQCLADFENWMDELEKDLNYQVIPIKKLVAVQLGAALYSADHVRHMT